MEQVHVPIFQKAVLFNVQKGIAETRFAISIYTVDKVDEQKREVQCKDEGLQLVLSHEGHVTSPQKLAEMFHDIAKRIEVFYNTPKCESYSIVREMMGPHGIKDVSEFTCFNCLDDKTCEYAYDLYNTHGDCLAVK